MTSTNPAEDRAKVSAINRSIRNIKNELESLSERNVLTDEQYDLLMANIPAEVTIHTLHNLPGATARNQTTSPAPSSNVTTALAALNVHDDHNNHNTPPPPAYNTAASPPPPPRNAPANARPEIAHAVAMYHYADPDPRDLDIEPNDHISVLAYVNPEWWEGVNVRTGSTGIFPRNYVRVENTPSPIAHRTASPMNEKAGGYYSAPPQAQSYYPPPQHGQQQQGGPYNSSVPPMAIAEQSTGDGAGKQPSKAGEMGKKFGKKLGNAAIFGAGATLGADLVNSIL